MAGSWREETRKTPVLLELLVVMVGWGMSPIHGDKARGEGAVGGGEDEVSLKHLGSCSFVSLKYHHPTRLLGECLSSNTPTPTKSFVTLLFPSLSPSSSHTNFQH